MNNNGSIVLWKKLFCSPLYLLLFFPLSLSSPVLQNSDICFDDNKPLGYVKYFICSKQCPYEHCCPGLLVSRYTRENPCGKIWHKLNILQNYHLRHLYLFTFLSTVGDYSCCITFLKFKIKPSYSTSFLFRYKYIIFCCVLQPIHLKTHLKYLNYLWVVSVL